MDALIRHIGIKWGDIAVALFALALCAGAWATGLGAPGAGNAQVQIYLDGQAYTTVPLDAQGIYEPLPGVQIEVAQGRARFVHSTCPDQSCIHMGWAQAPGQVLVCLPTRVWVKIGGDTPLDAVVG